MRAPAGAFNSFSPDDPKPCPNAADSPRQIRSGLRLNF
jgi:hypothetical protein